MGFSLFEFLDLKEGESSEKILKKIHLKRLKSELPKFVNDYLKNTYLETDDVRFFNELLWLSDNGEDCQKSIDHGGFEALTCCKVSPKNVESIWLQSWLVCSFRLGDFK